MHSARSEGVQRREGGGQPGTNGVRVVPGGRVQMRQALVGHSFDEQAAMLAPRVPVQKKEDGDAAAAPPEAGANEAPTLRDEGGEGPLSAEGREMLEGALQGQEAQAGIDLEIAKTITSKRKSAGEQVKAGKFDAFEDLLAFERSSRAAYPAETQAALETLAPTRDWLIEIVGTYLRTSPVGQEVLAEDKGPARGEGDKSAEIATSFIASLTEMESALVAAFPEESARAVKEIKVRRELFKLFIHHHDKSQADSGISSKENAVKGKLVDKATSCNVYQSTLLEKAFGTANAESQQEGGPGTIAMKETTTIGWDGSKTTFGPKKRNFAFFDNLGRAASQVGAWTAGGPGLQPKSGDMYVLAEGTYISHIGFFKFAEDCPGGQYQIWHTFDGGQPSGTPMTAKGFTQAVRDGALNNVKRAYDKQKNTVVTPSEAQLAKLRGQETSGKEGKAAYVNQDGKLRKVAGIIDVGKLIELDKEPAEPPDRV